MPLGKSFEDYLIEKLKDPEYASGFVEQVISYNDPDYLKSSLRQVVKAIGVSYFADKTGLSRQAIYKMFSEKGNPTYKNLMAILDVIGLELTVRPKPENDKVS